MNGKSNGFELMEPASPESLMPDSGLSPWWIAAALVVLVVLAALVFVWKRKVTAENPLAVRNAAHAAAVTAFATIAAADARTAAIQCSLVLRRYLSSAAGDPALFETHEEFVARHDALQSLTAEARAAAELCFTRLAAQKYAAEPPPAPAAEIVAESRALLETLHHGFAA